ncbi:MAG: DUF420 domain-containing protein [Verrucomicrobia bacterium]|nr:DUF420 domain-containing protein [Verrucomicrobiota bacterium]
MEPSTPSIAPRNTRFLILIAALSVAIPAAVAVLYLLPKGGRLAGIDVTFLPKLNAILNSLTTLALLAGFYFIKRGRVAAHRAAMLTAFVLSSLFLVSYVIYHAAATHTVYGGQGVLRPIYFFLLITHILLAAAVVPLVLMALYYAFTAQFAKHRRLNRWTFPIWLYVAVTGVLVYLLIAPYYPWNLGR